MITALLTALAAAYIWLLATSRQSVGAVVWCAVASAAILVRHTAGAF